MNECVILHITVLNLLPLPPTPIRHAFSVPTSIAPLPGGKSEASRQTTPEGRGSGSTCGTSAVSLSRQGNARDARIVTVSVRLKDCIQ